MTASYVPVNFQPQGKTLSAPQGARLVEAAADAGITIDMPCGGEGVCGKCRVVVIQGVQEANPAEAKTFSADELKRGWRLACQSNVSAQPMLVEVPETSVLAAYHKIMVRTADHGPLALEPVVGKRFVELPPPGRGDDMADTARVEQALGPVDISLELLAELPSRLRRADFRGTAVVAEGELLDFEAGNTAGESYAVAVDLGTTTIVAMLTDLATGLESAVASRLNPQTAFGDDVISRIQHAVETSAGLAELAASARRAIDELIDELSTAAGVPRDRIYEVAISGNTTMQHLFLGIDPRYLGELPFVPVVSRAVVYPALQLGIAIHPRGKVYVQPVIGGFVGGDTVSGVLATRMTERPGPILLVDIGTNGEIVLWADGKLTASATAAGPAFEGARITNGMRGSVGAIERVTIGERMEYKTIGGGRPVGICGSGLIDLAAELLRQNLISPEGRLAGPGAMPATLGDDLRRRVGETGGQPTITLASADESGTRRAIVFNQRDVRQLQLASGAIRAGIAILLKRHGLEPSDLKEVLIAGGFGNFIRRSNAQRIGLIPDTVRREAIRYQGNASLAGARMVLVSRAARREAADLAARTEHIDLSTDHGFQWAFADAMIFPEN